MALFSGYIVRCFIRSLQLILELPVNILFLLPCYQLHANLINYTNKQVLSTVIYQLI